jgi:two-component system NtrC family sensor kinase
MIVSQTRHILYVDDTEEQRYAMRRILERDGFTVLEAGSGAEAFRHLYPQLPSPDMPEILAVILDVKLPDMSGYDVCRRIKADPATAAIPVLQVSASFADPLLRAAGLSGGADAYVAQPVHPAELLSLVSALIRSYHAEKTLRFQAAASARLTESLDYTKTVAVIERVFVPTMADACFLCLLPLPGSPLPPIDTALAYARHPVGLPSILIAATEEVCATGKSSLVNPQTIVVPLEAGSRRLGSLAFVLHGDTRRYTRADVVLAEDLAARAALALQNAVLYTAQQTAQTALVQSEKLAAAGRLSAAIAHEINNPLEAITNLVFLIDTSPETPPTIRAYAQEALSELSRLTHIARQSLGFYRELTGPSTFDLNQSLEETVSIYGKRFMSRHILIGKDLAPGLTLTAVKGEIRQVFSNLLVNALDALPKEGSLHLETRALGPEAVLVRISDNGIGIPPENLDRIFEPFFSTKDGTGTGLGLWVSQNIIGQHGGTIRVTSNTTGPYQGTTFELTLPRAYNAN